MEPLTWLKSLLARCFQQSRFPQLFNDDNYRRNGVKFLFWHELATPNRPRGHEEGSTQADLFVEMPKATISVETKFGAELSRDITTDLADLKRDRPGVSDTSLWWDQVIRNLERGYVHTIEKHPGRAFFFIVPSMEKESPRTPFLSRYKDHPEQIRRQIESGYRFSDPDPRPKMSQGLFQPIYKGGRGSAESNSSDTTKHAHPKTAKPEAAEDFV